MTQALSGRRSSDRDGRGVSGRRPVVFFFAYANDRDDKARYLRNLPKEQRRVREAIAPAIEAGLCEVVERNNAGVDDVFDMLQDSRYRDRVAIFHYGGHAGPAELMLETPAGGVELAHAGGLAAFLGQQRGLALVFLNGCSSAGQVQGLLDAGVPAVIATAQAIDDAVATELAARFYRSLASGAPLSTAFAEAKAAVCTRWGASARAVYRSAAAPELSDGRWPWDLYVTPGAAEQASRWSLALAAHDPLFGLPALPEMELPPSPYKHLHWFTREDAAVFFGRGREIRDLYETLTALDAPPVVLLFGETGVGKSSLLAAGLGPRLETTHEVIYARRDGALGLLGTLARCLGVEDTDGVDHAAGVATAWRDRERAGRPLVVILDQIEEAWTQTSA
ncbi:MAG TPA: CHAT domain-containing protein, partial [Thermoanaerobaculia bacterium]|nr:CHAT domain-containing protein [Thermoanaerobaculia bacterium]